MAIINATMQQRRSAAATWSAANPVLAAGEIGVVTGASPMQFKIGDGSTAWNSLAYAGNAGLEIIVIAASDEITAITTGTNKVTFRMPFAMTLNAGNAGVRANVNTAPTDSTIIIDVNKSGVSILSTKLSIDATEKTSLTAASAVVQSSTPTTLADDEEITIDFDQVGATIAGKGVKISLIGYRT